MPMWAAGFRNHPLSFALRGKNRVGEVPNDKLDRTHHALGISLVGS